MPKREVSKAEVILFGGKIVHVLNKESFTAPDWLPLTLDEMSKDRLVEEVTQGKLKPHED